MSLVYQLHLSAPHCSGRGVRYRMLSSPEVDKVAVDAFALTSGKPGVEYRSAQITEGVKRMVVAVTKDVMPALVPTPSPDGNGQLVMAKPDLSKDELWRPVSVQTLDLEEGWKLDQLFNPKDMVFLTTAYSRLHEGTLAEVEEIVGKAIQVQTGP